MKPLNFDTYKMPLRYKIKYYIEEHNPFTQYKMVSSINEYANLSYKEKTVFLFWYKTPYISGGHFLFDVHSEREKLDLYLQRKFPFQYAVRDISFTTKYKIKRLYDSLRFWINPRQKWLSKQIPNEWCDKVTLLVDLNFAMVVHFVDGEKCFDNTDYDNSGDHHVRFAAELKDCYDYVKNRRPELQQQYENSYPTRETATGVYEVDYAENIRLESLISTQDTKYLNWIMINRNYFWV